jgi:hypothetical protein
LIDDSKLHCADSYNWIESELPQLTKLLAVKTSSSLKLPSAFFPNTPARMMSVEYLWNCSNGTEATAPLTRLAISRQANPIKSGMEKSLLAESTHPSLYCVRDEGEEGEEEGREGGRVGGRERRRRERRRGGREGEEEGREEGREGEEEGGRERRTGGRGGGKEGERGGNK